MFAIDLDIGDIVLKDCGHVNLNIRPSKLRQSNYEYPGVKVQQAYAGPGRSVSHILFFHYEVALLKSESDIPARANTDSDKATG